MTVLLVVVARYYMLQYALHLYRIGGSIGHAITGIKNNLYMTEYGSCCCCCDGILCRIDIIITVRCGGWMMTGIMCGTDRSI